MYSRALVGYEAVFGNDHERCKDVRVRLSDLATRTESEARSSKGPQVSQKVGIKIGQLHNVKDYSIVAIIFFRVQVIDILLVYRLIT